MNASKTNTSKIIKIAFYIIAALVLIELIGNVIGFLTSSWLIIAIAFAVWYFGFRNKTKRPL